jgi:phage shock protein PspC (stress-responsive transcriptional regulator)
MEPETPPSQPTPDQAPGDDPDTRPPAADEAAADPGDGGGDGDSDRMPPPPPPAGSTGPASTGGGGGWAPSFRILRSRHDKKLGGVAGGLAAATRLDPTLVRFAIVLSCLTGWAILGYLIAWVVIPPEDPAKGRYLVPAPEPTARYIRIGLTVLAVLGVLHVIGAVLGVLSAAIFGIGLLPFHILGLGDDNGFELGEAMLGLVLLIGGCLLLFRRYFPWQPATQTGPGSGFGSGGWAAPAGSPSASGSPGTGVALAAIAPGSAGSGSTAGSGASGATAGGYGGSSMYGPPPPPSGSGAASGGAAAFTARATAAARAARTNGPLLLVRATGWLVGLWFLAAVIIAGIFWLTGALEVRLPVLPVVTTVAALTTLGYALASRGRPVTGRSPRSR